MKLFLHIGYNKAGSTSIQTYFSENRAFFKKQGILYPETGIFSNAHYKLSGSLGIGVSPKKQEEKYTKETLLRKLHEEIQKEKPHTVLISSEYFILTKDFQIIKNYFKDFEVKIIVYLRRHDEWIESLYNQAIKTVQKPTWKKGIKNYIEKLKTDQPFPMNYSSFLEKLEQVFDKENIIVRPFEKEQFYQQSLIADSLQTIGYNFQNEIPEEIRKNDSLDTRLAEVVDDIKRSFQPIETQKVLIKQLNSLYFSKLESKKIFTLSQQDRQALIDENLVSYNDVAKKWLNNSSLFKNNEAKKGSVLQKKNNYHYLQIIVQLIDIIERKKNKF